MFMGASGHAGREDLKLVIVLVLAHHFVGDDPGADNRQDEQNDHYEEGRP
jgi:hypothetical protein